MADNEQGMESYREQALIDKRKVNHCYHPNETRFRYCIEDKHLRCKYFFIWKRKFKLKLDKLKKTENFESRFSVHYLKPV